MMDAKHIKHVKELGFTIVAEPDEFHVDYKIYQIDGWAGDGNPEWVGENDDVVDDVSNAAIFAHGFVRWDGCSNWHFDRQEQSMIHGCSKSDVQRIGDVLALCWDWTEDLCEKWDR